ncbi:MAG: hypothetical protein PF484_13480 [Bacteroidales bacterium]|jgi:hypothetical protein|nr:hypothetical protein [Bacteroidales bacterium]
MNTKVSKSVIGGLVATLVMTLFMFVGPMMGMPKMNPAEMLSIMMGVPVLVGWIMHFVIGVIFALLYIYLLKSHLTKVGSWVVKGIIFGLAVFVFAQIVRVIMGAIFGAMPSPEGNMVLMMIGSIVGHIVYGIIVVYFVKGAEA